MAMEVDVELKTPGFMLLDYGLFRSPNCQVPILARVLIVPIQILSQSVQSVVSSVHSIRIENWDDLEYEIISEQFRLNILFVKQKP